MSTLGSIYDTTNGQCRSAANLSGEHVPCDLATDHTGWAHQNSEHELMWNDREAIADVER